MIDIVNDTPEIIEVHVQDPPEGTAVNLELNTFLQLEPKKSLCVTTVSGKTYAVVIRKEGATTSGSLIYDLPATASIKISGIANYDGDRLTCSY
ncbi:MAG: hypothetical protein AAGD01_01550 [Acidobacteriota bacterium]